MLVGGGVVHVRRAVGRAAPWVGVAGVAGIAPAALAELLVSEGVPGWGVLEAGKICQTGVLRPSLWVDPTVYLPDLEL